MNETPRRRRRTGLRLRAIAATTAVAVLTTAGAASAQRDRAEKEDAVRRILSRACNDAAQLDGDGSCAARFDDSVLVFEREERRNRGLAIRTGRVAGARAERVVIETRVAFDERSYFFCGEARRDGRTPLYLVCSLDEAMRGPACVSETRQTYSGAGAPEEELTLQPLATLVATSASDCSDLARRLNGLMRGPRPGADPFVRDPG